MSAQDNAKPGKAQKTRRVSKEEYRSLLESASEGIVIVNGEGHIVLTNARVESLFGYKRKELLGQPIEILLPGYLRDAHAGHRAEYLTKPRNRPMGDGLDLVARRRDGTEFPVEVGLGFIKTDDEVLVMASITDIARRKRAETALQRYAERLTILREMDRAILAADAPAEIAQAAASLIRCLVPCEEANVTLFDFKAGTSTVLVSDANDDPLPRTTGLVPLEELQHTWKLQRGEVLAIQDLAACSDLSKMERRLLNEGVRAYISAPLIAAGQLVGSFNLRWRKPYSFVPEEMEIAREVADQLAIAIFQAQLHEKLQQSNGALRKAIQLKDEMLQNVSHELRTPLTHIIGYAEALTEGVLGDMNEDQAQAIKVIQDRAKALSRLVETLLSFHTLDTEHLNWEELDLKSLASDAVKTWQQRAQSAGLSLDLLEMPELPPVRGDFMRLRQVLDQLLDNALKFTPAGGKVLVQAENPGNEIWLSVSDTGIGIPPDQQAAIFEPFYQVNGSTTRTHGGMGIGLRLVQQIMSLHNGRVWAESDGIAGHGSTLYIALPVAGQAVR
ncbi:MAG: PAS domain S-box protein [Anaerolineae bacterium]|nr:PAS domain S-box protein [Anaerolineae bacterium]